MKVNRFIYRFFQVIALAYISNSHAETISPAAMPAPPEAAQESHAGHGSHGEHPGQPVSWTAYPILTPKSSGERRDAMQTFVVPQNIVADRIDDYSSNLGDAGGQRQLPLGMAGAKLDQPSSGGFHWLAAREQHDDSVRVASTVHYFGERGGRDPSAMFMQQKNDLEIIPQPFPREHSTYRAGEDWKFLVRFRGQALANQTVMLETRNGTRLSLKSDDLGIVSLHLPDDFQARQENPEKGTHAHGRRSADFLLATEYQADGMDYVTAFNGKYGPNAFDQRSLAWGLGFILLGMLSASPLLRPRKEQDKSAATPAAAQEDK